MRTSLLAAAIFGLDRFTKHLVESRMQPYESHTVIPGFLDIVRSSNPGVAFGLLASSPDLWRTGALIGFSIAALIFLAVIFWRTRGQNRLTSTAIALIFGGAAGNVFDRFRWGSVTDFLDFYVGNWHWYTFNVADTAITIGAAILLYQTLEKSRAERARKAHA